MSVKVGQLWKAKSTNGDSPKDYIRIVKDLGYNAFSVAFLQDDGDQHTLYKGGIQHVYEPVDKQDALKRILRAL